MRDPRLQLLPPVDGRVLRVREDVDDSDAVQANHLLEVNEASVVPVDVVDRDAVVLQSKRGCQSSERCRPATSEDSRFRWNWTAKGQGG